MGALKQGHQRKKILTEWSARFFNLTDAKAYAKICLTDAKAYAICVRQELMGVDNVPMNWKLEHQRNLSLQINRRLS
jgi:hypothetical protein